jgi:hypothetical protein
MFPFFPSLVNMLVISALHNLISKESLISNLIFLLTENYQSVLSVNLINLIELHGNIRMDNEKQET